MQSLIYSLFVVEALFVTNLSAQLPNSMDSYWTNELNVQDGVIIRWKNSNEKYLEMEMTAPTKGYIAVGFSPNGAMAGSDIIMGWVNSGGQAQILDLYAIGNSPPRIDDSQDVELISGSENENGTTIRFRRKWDTCDLKNDMKIGNDTIRLIWSMNDVDPFKPVMSSEFKPTYHGVSNRGVRRVYMRNKIGHIPFPDNLQDEPEKISDPTIKFWDVRMDKNVIDKEDDVYFCKIAKFPKQAKKQHLIGYRPLLQKENKFRIHHIIMYECLVPNQNSSAVFEQYVNHPGGKCYTPNMPPEWGQYCTTIPILWTSGSEGNMFPSNTGNPLGEEHDGTTYFMFEVHYDNPELNSFTDSSGFRLFYTENLREYDSSAILVGQKVSPFHVVPHGMDSFTSFGYCTSECTAQTIPKKGITVTTVLLHAHLAGKRIVLRHLRNGKELEPIAVESHYDYNYQQVRVIDPPRIIFPGDELLTECEYNTTWKTSPSFGGLGTRDEMCMSFIYYYPKIELSECKTQQEFNSFIKALNVEKVDGDILKEINMPYKPKDDQTSDYGDNPWYLKNSTYDSPLNALDAMNIIEPQPTLNTSQTLGSLIKRSINWSKAGSAIEASWNQGEQYAFCTGSSKKRFPLKNYVVKLPKYEAFVEQKSNACST